MADPTLLEIDRNIRSLSALITRLNKQVKVPENSDHISPTLVACNHVAILLTRGIEDAGTGTTDYRRKVVAVGGRLSSELSLVVAVDAYVGTQNPIPQDQPNFRIDHISPSPRTLEELTGPPCVPAEPLLSLFLSSHMLSYRLNDDPLQDYAADLLGTFRDLRSTDDRFLFMEFIVRSCLPKITRRLHADLYIFQHPLEEILDGWTPHTGDVMVSKQVRIRVDQDVRPDLVSILVVGEEDKYEWNISTASTWIMALCRLIKSTKRLANDCRHRSDRDSKAIDPNILLRLVIALNTLFFLLYRIPIRELLSLPSIRLRLKLELKDNHSAVFDEDEQDMALEANEEIHSLALRCLRNTVAWQSAIHYIFASVQKSRSFKDITLDFVVIPVVTPDTCASEEPIVNSTIEYMLERLHLDREAEPVQSMIQEIKNKVSPLHFCGTVHCDASLMGMVVACMDNRMLLPSGMTHRELTAIKKLVTTSGMSTIGMGKKCCWCCSLLAELLHAADPRVTFDVAASNGLIFPWALPTVGISMAVARSMEAALTLVWQREVVKFARQFTKPAVASIQTMSSPSGSISGDFHFEDAQYAGTRHWERLNPQVVRPPANIPP